MGVLTEELVVDEIPVQVRRNRRRRTRIGLGFDPAGHVILDAPVDATLAELSAVVSEHGRWLKRKLEAVRRDSPSVPAPRFESGELIQYRGQAYELKVQEGANAVLLRGRDGQLKLFPGLEGMGGELVVRLPNPLPARVGARLKRWFQQEAERLFAERLERFADLPWLAGTVPPWRSRYMRSQWGSCSADGRIALNTHLIKTPVRLVDYVILHELCHLVHHDHSRRFYGLMAQHMPDWETRRGELDGYLPVLLHD